jgi:hypothetical protein
MAVSGNIAQGTGTLTTNGDNLDDTITIRP